MSFLVNRALSSLYRRVPFGFDISFVVLYVKETIDLTPVLARLVHVCTMYIQNQNEVSWTLSIGCELHADHNNKFMEYIDWRWDTGDIQKSLRYGYEQITSGRHILVGNLHGTVL